MAKVESPKKNDETDQVKTQPAETPAVAQAPKKSNTALIVIIVLLVLFIGLPALGFGVFWFFVGSKVNKITDDLSKGKVNITAGGGAVSVDTNAGQSWPSSAPTVVPKFTAGKITASTRFGDVWSVTATGVKVADLDSYKAKLVAAGWTIDTETNYDSLAGWTAKNGTYQVTTVLTTSESSLILGITKVLTDSSSTD